MISKPLLTVLFAVAFSAVAYAQNRTVSGTVTGSDDGLPLPQVSVLLKGTTTGVPTNMDGEYRLNLPAEGGTLVFSFLGYVTQEIEIGSRTVIDVVLEPEATSLDEVVVTALGIKRSQKAVTYAAQNVDTEDFSKARSLNVVNSLSGKVAGLNFSTTSNGVGSSSRVVLRGNRSLTGNNQPLYVIDGVPIINSAGTPSGDTGGLTGSDGISNINPEDIASISVLKGPSAAALYGTRASNGVIVITTKSGEGAAGSGFSVSSNFMTSSAYNLQNVQNEYGQGDGGRYVAGSRNSWGPKINEQSVNAWQPLVNARFSGPDTYSLTRQPDNAINFFETGYNLSNSFSGTMAKENLQGYFSYTNTFSKGIVPGNELSRHNFNVRLTGQLSEKLSVDSKVNYIAQEITNALRTGEESIGSAIYTIPRSLPFEQYKNFEYADGQGQLHQNYIDNRAVGAVGGNPFWSALRKDTRVDNRSRLIGVASLKYQFFDDLSLQLRSGIDTYTDKGVSKNFASASFNQDKGSYGESIARILELNSDFLLAYNKSFNELSLNLNFGGNQLIQRSSSLGAGGLLSRRNFFSLGNTENTGIGAGFSRKQIHSLYGFAQIGFRNYLFLDVTARNDWSSALPAHNRSFFYPSVGISGVISDMVELPEVISYAKVRASYAQVGNDTDPFQLSRTLNYTGLNGGILASNTTLANPNLKPEISTSTEFGADIRFFDNRFGIDFTYFKTNTVDQIFTINTPESSGFAREVINGGEVENKGMELVINATPVETAGFTWDITANYASYASKVISINDDREELVFGDGRLVQSKIKKGGEYGDLYIRGFKRTENGQILVDENGIPEFTPGFDIRAGNFNPDWTGGVLNKFQYKNLTLSFLIDIRVGGEIISYTQARTSGIGVNDRTLPFREGGLVVKAVVAKRNAAGEIISTTPNTKSITAERYWSAVASRDPRSAEDFVFDATNVRLRELVLGYSLPKSMLNGLPFKNINVSLVGRNLFFILNKAKFFDPEQGVGIGNLQGVESFNLPVTRDFGFNVKLEF